MIGDRGPRDKDFVKVYHFNILVGCRFGAEEFIWCRECIFRRTCNEQEMRKMPVPKVL